MKLAKYSLGTGDRFGQQGAAQLAAIEKAQEKGTELAIVWNKSHREHTIVGTDQRMVREEAEAAVVSRGWKGQYLVDADHIGLENVDLFLESSDFFTLDVADFIGRKASWQEIDAFVEKHLGHTGRLDIPGIDMPLEVDRRRLEEIAGRYLQAVKQAGRIYRYIADKKGASAFVTEVSMDETAEPQTPVELFFILAALADEDIPVQTVAPKFTGRFNKGVDYVGDLDLFSREFEDDLCVIKEAVGRFSLPANLKLSVHSGSDKFSIYGAMGKLIRKHDMGLHVKTAGTTWLEELIGLAEAGGEGLAMAKRIYDSAYQRYDELCGPYASVIDIDRQALPMPETVASWSADAFTAALRHDQACPGYDSNLRQLLHVGYKVAAELGEEYLDCLHHNSGVVAKNVTANLFERHIVPLFVEDGK